ncbi:hypothetical protein JCGZ_04287 [Jatropha curcas]|uniref:EF-hand domain-containing protein n=1 Tax=Jatropha curcas TaxID=180498 RepID=A0A067KQF7_JATCU|nr:hypothetical protein JCGZ_04287 [Jatropha curcas]
MYNYKGIPNYETSSTEDLLMRKVFLQFDVNGDRVLSKEEIMKAFEYLGALFPGYWAERGINCADTNGDGQVDLTELAELVKYARNHGFSP